jgi:membrane protein YdbS with pleckstrin-like domain
MSAWRDTVMKLLRVPAAPVPPPGGHVQTFRAAPNYFWFKCVQWAIGTALLVISVVAFDTMFVSTVASRAPRAIRWIFGALAIGGVVLVILRATFGWAVLRLDYELRWYMISDRAIRIREGILTVREKTIALANIQNTSIHQGPLQRLLGIADVEVRTAGGGSGESSGRGKGQQLGEPMHVGYFRGVDNAAQLRDIILAGVRKHRDSGLGDPEEEVHHLDPAERLLAETRALRELLSGVRRP